MELPNTSVAFNASCLTSWPKCKASYHWISIFLAPARRLVFGGRGAENQRRTHNNYCSCQCNQHIGVYHGALFYYLTGSLNRKYSNYANEYTVLDRENISSIRSSMVQAYAYFQLTCVNRIKLGNTRINTQIPAPDEITISDLYAHLRQSKQEHNSAISQSLDWVMFGISKKYCLHTHF